MASEICDRMNAEVAVREQEYVVARERLAKTIEEPDSALYQELKIACDDARIDFEIAGLEFERHRNHHAKAN